MMRDRLGILIACVACTLSLSCASALQKNMESWMGSQESQLLAAWGAPDTRVSLTEGGTVYTWIDTWYQQNGQPASCRKTFTMDTRGVVVNWSYSNCPVRIWQRE